MKGSSSSSWRWWWSLPNTFLQMIQQFELGYIKLFHTCLPWVWDQYKSSHKQTEVPLCGNRFWEECHQTVVQITEELLLLVDVIPNQFNSVTTNCEYFIFLFSVKDNTLWRDLNSASNYDVGPNYASSTCWET